MGRIALPLGLAGALLLGGCAYDPSPPDPIRVDSSPADVRNCRRLGSVGEARTDGYLPPFAPGVVALEDAPPALLARRRGPVPGIDFRERYEIMRDRALALGATDLLLLRRRLRDWSYVEGIAYRCRR